MSRNRLLGVLVVALALSLVWLARPYAAGQAGRASSASLSAFLATRGALTSLAAHCDTMDGPVVKAAAKALDAGNVNLVLIWVQPKDEAEIRQSFEQALAVRKLGGEAQPLADRHFFQTLVRVHRAGEGAPYTGLKPAGTPVEPAVLGADEALTKGEVEPFAKMLAHEVEEGLIRHFNEAMEAKSYSADNVEAGRKFVKAYVEYVHYAERIAAAAASTAHGHFPEGAGH